MKKIFMIALLAGIATTTLKAQDYNWGVGLRGGASASGISAKVFMNRADAIEGLLSFQKGINFYALYERNVPLNAKGLNFYYGAGGNLGNWEKKNHKDKFTVGIDGVIGLEYKIENAPIVVGVDYKPCLNFAGHTGFKYYDFGFNVRVAF